jgi:CheY-like chemotaxis protein
LKTKVRVAQSLDMSQNMHPLSLEKKATGRMNTSAQNFGSGQILIASEKSSPTLHSTNSSEVSRTVRIIIAEDETNVQRIYSILLKSSGFAVTKTFDNGKDLADFMGNNIDPNLEPDLIITDLRMPRMDGIEASKIIRAIKPQMKIILATAYDVPKDAVSLFEVVLRKPFGKKEMFEAVFRCVNHAHHK